MVEWKECTNKSATNEKIQNIQNYCRDMHDINNSPIDAFYVERDKILSVCKDVDLLAEYEVLGPLLYVGIISATENYLRDIFAKCIKMCIICRKQIADHNISVGSIMWQQGKLVEKGIFENISFSDGSQIKKELKKCLKIEIKPADLVWSLLEEFDKLCQMRHAIVHSSRLLAGKNAVKINIPPRNSWIEVKVGYAEIQECASICSSLVCGINTFLFNEMAKRWAVDWRKEDFWDEKKEKETFDELWITFCSTIDSSDENFFSLTKTKCKNNIKKEYNID